MADRDDSDPKSSSARHRGGPEHNQGDIPDLGLPSDPAGRDFGDSAGYGSGGSTRDYQEVVGENPVTTGRPNPLDAVIPPEPSSGQDEDRQDPDTSG